MLTTSNEDGGTHVSAQVLYALQHIGLVIPPQSDSYWVGEAGSGPSYLDEEGGGQHNAWTTRNTVFMTWNMLHLARMLKGAMLSRGHRGTLGHDGHTGLRVLRLAWLPPAIRATFTMGGVEQVARVDLEIRRRPRRAAAPLALGQDSCTGVGAVYLHGEAGSASGKSPCWIAKKLAPARFVASIFV